MAILNRKIPRFLWLLWMCFWLLPDPTISVAEELPFTEMFEPDSIQMLYMISSLRSEIGKFWKESFGYYAKKQHVIDEEIGQYYLLRIIVSNSAITGTFVGDVGVIVLLNEPGQYATAFFHTPNIEAQTEQQFLVRTKLDPIQIYCYFYPDNWHLGYLFPYYKGDTQWRRSDDM